MSRPVGSATLDRGLRILEILAESDQPMKIDDVAAELGVHRSNAYRLLRTLEDRRLVVRDAVGGLSLGARMAALAAGVSQDLKAAALPELTEVAGELGVTCFVAVADLDECVTLASVEPRTATVTVAQRPGSRHFIGDGAPGRAILAQLPRDRWPHGVSQDVAYDVDEIGRDGPFYSHDEVVANLHSVAVPMRMRAHPPAAVGVVYLTAEPERALIGERLRQAAQRIVTSMGN